MQVITDDGARIHYRRTGNGPAVLLLHGFATDGRLTWDQTGWTDVLVDSGHTALVVDLRGHGASTSPCEAGHCTTSRVLADLIDVLDDAQLQQVDVLGYSLGAVFALELARAFPNRVRKLVLGGLAEGEVFSPRFRDAARAFFMNGQHPSDPIDHALLTMATSVPGHDPAALLACVEGLTGTRPPLVEHAPVLVAAGERDTIAAGARRYAARANARYVPVPGRDHVNTLSARAFKRAALQALAE